MKPSNLKYLLPGLAFAFAACSGGGTTGTTTTTTAAVTTTTTTAATATAGSNTGGSSTGGSGTGGSSTGAAGGTSTGGHGSSTGAAGGSSTGAAGPTIGSACTLPSGDNPGQTGDPCLVSGLACNGTGVTTCELPNEFETCTTKVGCATDFSCESVSATANACFQNCTTTADCTDPTTNCISAGGTQKICNSNICGPDVGTQGPSSGPDYYGPCNAAGTNDGTCLPIPQPGNTNIGLCFQNGSAATGVACSASRSDAGPLCELGGQCVMTAAGGSICTPVCASVSITGDPDGGVDGGPSLGCATGNVCLGFSGADFGACFVDCTGGETCTTPTTCQANAGTLPDGGPLSICD